MKLIFLGIFVCVLGSFVSVMAFDTNDEYTKAYLEINPRVVRTDVYEQINDLVPELAADSTKKAELISEYTANNDVIADAFIDCYKKYLSLDDLKRIKQIEQDETYKKIGRIITKDNILIYLNEICKNVNGEEMIDIAVPPGKEDFFNLYLDFVNSTQGNQQVDFTAIFQNLLAPINVVKANTFAKNNFYRFCFIKLTEGGITETDLRYLEPLIKDKAIRQRSNATLEMTRINMKELSKKMLEDYSQYLEKKGYMIPSTMKNYLQKFYQ